MADRKAFLLRLDPALLAALQRWANDEVRSLNGQIEFLLRRSLQESGRRGGLRAVSRLKSQLQRHVARGGLVEPRVDDNLTMVHIGGEVHGIQRYGRAPFQVYRLPDPGGAAS